MTTPTDQPARAQYQCLTCGDQLPSSGGAALCSCGRLDAHQGACLTCGDRLSLTSDQALACTCGRVVTCPDGRRAEPPRPLTEVRDWRRGLRRGEDGHYYIDLPSPN